MRPRSHVQALIFCWCLERDGGIFFCQREGGAARSEGPRRCTSRSISARTSQWPHRHCEYHRGGLLRLKMIFMSLVKLWRALGRRSPYKIVAVVCVWHHVSGKRPSLLLGLEGVERGRSTRLSCLASVLQALWASFPRPLTHKSSVITAATGGKASSHPAQ